MPIPPSRDRLARPVDISTLLPGAARRVNLIVDEPGLRRTGLSWNGVKDVPRDGGNRGTGAVIRPAGVQRAGVRRGRNQQRAVATGRETRTPGSTTATTAGGRVRRTPLPSWYPRRPLGDITAITRAIERRRAELGLNRDTGLRDTAAASSNAHLEPEIASSTPTATITLKPDPSPATQVWRMKPGNVIRDSSDSITPQKRLLMSIEKVREIWLEEQRKLQRTPAAKRAERETKVRVLMSLR